jgi:pre-mRNA-processing factor 19
MQSEYDSLVLELFDMKKALQQTREELSQALYQNDAAVRVIARVVLERDLARKELADINATFATASTTQTSSNKRRKLDGTVDVVPAEEQSDTIMQGQDSTPNVIPKHHLELIEQKWKELSLVRKTLNKKKKQQQQQQNGGDSGTTNDADSYATIEMLQNVEIIQKKNWHKTSSQPGILAMVNAHTTTTTTTDNDDNTATTIVTAGKDRQIIMYDGESVIHKVNSKVMIKNKCLDTQNGLVACIGSDNTLRIFSMDGDNVASADQACVVPVLENGDDDEDDIIGLVIHPTGNHVLVGTVKGSIHVFAIESNEDDSISINKIAVLYDEKNANADGNIVESTCFGLHPDGLILGIGCSDGKVVIWDLRAGKIASVLQGHTDQPILSIAFSENGYHVASSSNNDTILLWDLRKQKVVAQISATNEGEEGNSLLITSMAFCPIGKYIAFGTNTGSITIHTGKDWDTKVNLSSSSSSGSKSKENGAVTGIVWGKNAQSLYTCSDSERNVKLWAIPAKDP